MEIARWIILVVAAVTAIGGLCADWFIPFGARQHLKNPAWMPHAKFHNAQAILMGFGQGVLAIGLLVFIPLGVGNIVLAALISSIYWAALMVAPMFPGTAWVDPEFAEATPTPLGLHPQQLIGYILLCLLAIAVLSALAT
ncbi:hypothetical protein E2F50_17600 [Rhizobium deserti]|uniref:Uncharacterized protein n=2 Tax=Rhizobium deserti TaxID=2547961 RepID=A0A4R5UBA6_9HYPH|nr:hypothetical protein E2F50_17600 [Rhizobium deserti]